MKNRTKSLALGVVVVIGVAAAIWVASCQRELGVAIKPGTPQDSSERGDPTQDTTSKVVSSSYTDAESRSGEVPPADVRDNRSITGHVVDSSGVPVEGATVVFHCSSATSSDPFGSMPTIGTEAGRTSTNDLGEFSWKCIVNHTFDISVSASGFATSNIMGRVSGDDMMIIVSRLGFLNGRVRRQLDRTVVAGASVIVRQQSDSRAMCTTSTDSNGMFRVGSLGGGSYFVEVIPLIDRAPRWTPVEIVPFIQTTLEIDVDCGMTVAGEVVSAVTGAPIADATVGQTWRCIKPTTTDSMGRFTYEGIAKEELPYLVAHAVGYSQSTKPIIEEQGEAIKLRFSLAPERRAIGKVVDSLGRPLGRVTIRACTDGSAKFTSNHCLGDVLSDDQGRFEVRSIPQEVQPILRLTQPGCATMTASEFMLDTTGSVLDFGSIKLSPGGEIEGSVVFNDGPGAAGAFVRVKWLGSSSYPESFTTADSRGFFRFVALQPGDYEVSCRATLGSSSESSQRVTVVQGGASTRLVLIISAQRSISGHVVDQSGVGIPFVWIRGLSTSSVGVANRQLTVSMTKADGSFSLIGEAGAVYTVFASVSDLRGVAHALLGSAKIRDVKMGESNLVIKLVPGSLITGTVVDANGASITGAIVSYSDIESGVSLGRTSSSADGAFSICVPSHESIRLVVSRSAATGAEVTSRAAPWWPSSTVVDGVRGGSQGIVIRLPDD